MMKRTMPFMMNITPSDTITRITGLRLFLPVEPVDHPVRAAEAKAGDRDADRQGQKRGRQRAEGDAERPASRPGERIVIMVPKAIVSPCAKFENRRMP
jgi:hypothetical protein